MAYEIKRQETTGLFIVVDTDTGKTLSRAELPQNAINLLSHKKPKSKLSSLKKTLIILAKINHGQNFLSKRS